MNSRDDLNEFRSLIAALAATFRAEADEALLTGYWLGLNDLALPRIKRAVQHAMRTCRFMPTVVELREMSGAMSIRERTVRAFEILGAAVQGHGYYQSVKFDDPALNATVRNLGGWMKICDTPEDQWESYFRRDFERVYAALASSSNPLTDSASVGFFAQQNGANGLPVQPPVLIRTGLPALPNAVIESPALPCGDGPKRIGAVLRGVD